MPMQREQLVRHKIEIYVEARDDATAEEYYRRIANAADDGDTLNSLWVETQIWMVNPTEHPTLCGDYWPAIEWRELPPTPEEQAQLDAEYAEWQAKYPLGIDDPNLPQTGIVRAIKQARDALDQVTRQADTNDD
jgi:hypothetical protein